MYQVTLIPGDGIGLEISENTRRVIDAAGVKIDWDIQQAGLIAYEQQGSLMPEGLLSSIEKNGIALKGPTTTPVGGGHRSVNVSLRQHFDLYANVRPTKNYPGVFSRYSDVDLVVVRENTEDLYMGIEHKIGDYAAESIKILTRPGCERIARYAFEYARKEGRRKVTAVHKANIMKLTDGLFLNVVREVASGYPDIEFEDSIVDAMCARLVQWPERYDVLVLPNLYGDIISDLCAGLVGGLGIAPGANIGKKAAIFEPIHGSAPDIAGKNIANPSSMILSGALMLSYLGEKAAAEKIENAISQVLAAGKTATCDLGGTSSTSDFTEAVIKAMA